MTIGIHLKPCYTPLEKNMQKGMSAFLSLSQISLTKVFRVSQQSKENP